MALCKTFRIVLAGLAVAACAALWFGYSPRHWLRQVSFAVVKVDDRTVPADVYFGNPRRSETEAVALVRVPGVGDYLLDFDDETYREASSREFIRVPRGAWSLRPMDEGQFGAPSALPKHE